MSQMLRRLKGKSVWVFGKHDEMIGSTDTITKAAEKFGGRATGSGTDLSTGERDISYQFETQQNASRFASVAKRMRVVKKVQVV